MSTTKLIRKAVTGGSLADHERLALSPPLLALLASGGYIELMPSDRRRLSKTLLAQLAIGGRLELTRTERDSLSPLALALLAVSRHPTLHPIECSRLPAGLREIAELPDRQPTRLER